MRNPTVTVLLATYNGERFLAEQLDSLLAQKYRNWILLVHDDGSTDATCSVVKDYACRHPDRIRLLDDGVTFGTAAENFSHLLANVDDADYVMLCDQDDVWYHDKIEKTLRKMQKLEAQYGGNMPILVHTDMQVADVKLSILDPSFWHFSALNPARDRFEQLLMQNIVTGCTVMINRPLLYAALPIPAEAIMHDWWLALVAARFGKIGRLDEATLSYRQHGCNDTGAKRFGWKDVVRRLPALVEPDELYRQIARNCRQAAAFRRRFETQLTTEEQKMLRSFAALRSLSWVQRRTLLVRHGILKHGTVRNLGLLVRI